ncbi:MAG: metallophosphoesterase [Anaerolineae bacterium]|nr:metallophosphoesterase [Anaerolineae bacterium]
MSEPIRVLHFADVHLGAENYGPSDPDSGVSGRVNDCLQRLDEMIGYAREGDVDLALFAGDAFHSRSPNPTYQREFAQRMLALSRLAPTVMLLGHLDRPPNASRASTLEIYDTLRVPNIWVAQAYQARLITTKRGDVVLGAAPFLSRNRLLADVATPGMSREQQDAEAARILAEWHRGTVRVCSAGTSVCRASRRQVNRRPCWGRTCRCRSTRWRTRAGIMSRWGMRAGIKR